MAESFRHPALGPIYALTIAFLVVIAAGVLVGKESVTAEAGAQQPTPQSATDLPPSASATNTISRTTESLSSVVTDSDLSAGRISVLLAPTLDAAATSIQILDASKNAIESGAVDPSSGEYRQKGAQRAAFVCVRLPDGWFVTSPATTEISGYSCVAYTSGQTANIEFVPGRDDGSGG